MKYFFTIVIISIMCFFNVKAQQFDTELFPELLSPSNAGTDFLISTVPIYYNPIDEYNIVKLYISSSTSSKVRITSTFFLIDTTIEVEANKVTEHNMPARSVIPSNKLPNQAPPNEYIYENRALKVSSDSPILLYVLIRLKDYSEGYLALPTNFLDINYNISTFNDYTNNQSAYSPSTSVIVAYEDNTRVTFTLGGNSSTIVKKENGDTLTSGENIRRVLNSGDVWVIHGQGANNDLSGSNVFSNKPIAVYTGNYCAQVDVNQKPCAYLIEQELPTKSYSNRYYITPFYGRERGSWVKVNAYEEDTKVSLNNSNKGNLLNPIGQENDAFLSFRLNNDNKPAIISSEKRINVTQYNSGDYGVDDKGIPFKMQALSSDHFSKKIAFHLPAVSNEYLFSFNYVNIVFKLNNLGQIPDDLTITRYSNSGEDTKKVEELTEDNPVQFPIAEPDGSRMYCLTVPLARYGRYVINSSTPIGAVVYGNSEKFAFGSPAFIYMKNNDKLEDTLAPDVNVTELGIAEYIGSIIDKPNNSKIRSNIAMIHLIADSSYNFKLDYDPFLPGIDFNVSFQLRAINIKDNAVGYLRIVDAAGNDTILRFEYSNVPVKPKITLNQLQDTVFCSGDQIDLEYTITNSNFLGENSFAIKLGKENPNKPNYPITLNQIKSSLATKIDFNIPRGLISSDDYFIYVESTYPHVYSDTIYISIFDLPELDISGYTKVSANREYKYYTDNKGTNLLWSVQGGEIIGENSKDTVLIKWSNIGTNTITLGVSNENCSENVEYSVKVGEEYFNQIEGLDNACQYDSLFYNSYLNTGTFSWSVEGGKIVGNDNKQLVRIAWLEEGVNHINLVYTDENGYIQEFTYEVTVSEVPEKPSITRDKTVLISSSQSGNQWYFNGEIITGARAKTYDTKDIEGDYTVQVTLEACESELSEIFKYKILSVKSIVDKNILSIYPNPAIDNLHISVNNIDHSIDKITIYDYKMSIIDIIKINNIDDNIEINYSLNNLSSGCYFIRLESVTENYFDKFIISK